MAYRIRDGIKVDEQLSLWLAEQRQFSSFIRYIKIKQGGGYDMATHIYTTTALPTGETPIIVQDIHFNFLGRRWKRLIESGDFEEQVVLEQEII